MCGITGFIDPRDASYDRRGALERMMGALVHRGPDSDGAWIEGAAALGFRRLAIHDLAGGAQPLFNEDRSLVMVCNGEVFNHRRLRAALEARGHRFATRSDVEVLLHLYEERGEDFLEDVDGQVAAAVLDRRAGSLLLARDVMGVLPLFYGVFDGALVFGSEIKALLEHPRVPRVLDPAGLDQVFSFPGLVSPQTMFAGVSALAPGELLVWAGGEERRRVYRDVAFPRDGEHAEVSEVALLEALRASVADRLDADVPVGYYLSGGLDSSLIAALVHEAAPEAPRVCFSVGFADPAMDEGRFQRLMVAQTGAEHCVIPFDEAEIGARFRSMIWHAECAVKESYNTCAMALAEAARDRGIKVILSGEGADELLAGYVGYRVDEARQAGGWDEDDPEALIEADLREQLWGDPDLFYEKQQHALRGVKRALYGEALRGRFEGFECVQRPLVRKEALAGRHRMDQRAYLDLKLRLADHLLGDHGDRMSMAAGVEVRHPFLDRRVVALAVSAAPGQKVRGGVEKHLLRQVARGRVPDAIVQREKFGFHAPGSPALLRRKLDWVEDALSAARLREVGLFDPEAVARLRARYAAPGFRLAQPYEDDLLMIVLSAMVFMDVFGVTAP